MKTHERDFLEKPSFWQLVFLQSKVNGATYHGEQLAAQKWMWPQGTYFQQRLYRAKWYQAPGESKLN
jgi:hypothetical protein